MKKIFAPRVISASKNRGTYQKLAPVAVNMRKNPTKEEKKLWDAVRGKKLGVKFRRQHVIHQFIVDFYSIEIGLVIEIDGEIHSYHQGRDKERDMVLHSLGCTVLRFPNSDIDRDLKGVLAEIKKVIDFLQGKTENKGLTLGRKGLTAPSHSGEGVRG